MKRKNKEKNQVISFSKQKMTAAERQAEHDSIAKINVYQKTKKQIYKKIERELANTVQVKFDVYEGQLIEMIGVLRSDLLDIEIKLQDALSKARKEFFDYENTIVQHMLTLLTEFI
jgi:hypothetical protein